MVISPRINEPFIFWFTLLIVFTLTLSSIAYSFGPLPTRTPKVTRKDAAAAGFVFPSFLNRSDFRADFEKQFRPMSEEQFNTPPDALKRVFINPAMPLSEVERRFQEKEGKSAVDNLKLAFFGTPEYVFPWFRVGQAVAMALHGASLFANDDFHLLLEAIRLRFPDAEISPSAGEELLKILRNHRDAVVRQDPQWITKAEQELLNLAAQADVESEMPSDQQYLARVVTLIVVLGFALSGFFLFRGNRAVAVIWLLFFVIALPPSFAITFESHKLKGQNLVEMYKIGVGAIPYVGKLLSP